MSTKTTLTLTAFTVDAGEPAIVHLTVTGKGEIPDLAGVKVGPAKKNVRVIDVTAAPENYPSVYALGAIIKLGEVVPADDDAQFFGWYKAFTTVENGGTHEPDEEDNDTTAKPGDDPVLAAIAKAQKAVAAPAPAEPAPAKGKGKKKPAEAPEAPAEPAPAAKAKGKKAPAEKPPKAPKAPKAEKPKPPVTPKKERTVTDPAKEAIAAATKTLTDALGKIDAALVEAVTALGGRRVRLVISDVVATVEQKVTGTVIQPRGQKRPLYHVPGRVFSTTKRHSKAEWGTCSYSVRSEADGSYTMVDFKGPRTDIKVGATFKNANDLLRLLTGRDYPRVQVYRYFETFVDPKGAAAAK